MFIPAATLSSYFVELWTVGDTVENNIVEFPAFCLIILEKYTMNTEKIDDLNEKSKKPSLSNMSDIILKETCITMVDTNLCSLPRQPNLFTPNSAEP